MVNTMSPSFTVKVVIGCLAVAQLIFAGVVGYRAYLEHEIENKIFSIASDIAKNSTYGGAFLISGVKSKPMNTSLPNIFAPLLIAAVSLIYIFWPCFILPIINILLALIQFIVWIGALYFFFLSHLYFGRAGGRNIDKRLEPSVDEREGLYVENLWLFVPVLVLSIATISAMSMAICTCCGGAAIAKGPNENSDQETDDKKSTTQRE